MSNSTVKTPCILTDHCADAGKMVAVERRLHSEEKKAIKNPDSL